MTDQVARSWAYLTRVIEPPNVLLGALVGEVGAVEAAQAVRGRRVPAGYEPLLRASRARCESDCAADDLETAATLGFRLLTPDDDDWPAQQFDLLDRAGLENGPVGAPIAVWVKGTLGGDTCDRTVGIVGTRAASQYGEQVTRMIAGDLVLDGWTVVSGAAYGIDGVAHRAAVAGQAPTVAVLACGLDRPYPAGHGQLLEAIAGVGAVVSEYPPGTTPAKHRFLSRNRLVAALSRVVVVVEAGRRSGAANTAAWTRRLGIPLGAVPGPVTAASSVGCHEMIADGVATLVTSRRDITELAGVLDPSDRKRPRRSTDRLTATQLRVHDAFPASGVMTVGEVAYLSGVSVPETRSALATLEINGLIVGDGSAWSLHR